MKRLLFLLMLCLMGISCELFILDLQEQLNKANERAYLQNTSEMVLQIGRND